MGEQWQLWPGWCKGGAKVVVSNGSDGRAPWKSQLRGLNEMENAIPNYASVWGYPACPVHPGHPLNIFSSPAFRLGCHRSHCWKPAAAAAGWRMKDDFVFLPRLPHSRSHILPNSRLVLYLFVFIIQQNQLRFRYPRNMYLYAYSSPFRKLVFWAFDYDCDCHVDVMFTFMHYCFRMSWALSLISSAQSRSSAFFLFFCFYFRFFWSWKSGISELLQLILDNIVASNCYKNHL